MATVVTLAHLLVHAAHRHGERAALFDGDHTVTWGALLVRVRARAAALLRAGLRPGDALAVQGGNDLGFVTDLIAGAWLGATVAPLHPGWRDAFLAERLAMLGGPWVVGEGSGLPEPAGDPGPPADRHRVTLFTSGSTGTPKAVVHHGESLASCGRRVAALLDLGPDDRTFGQLPLAFHYGLTQVTAAMAAGAACVLVRAATPADALDRAAAFGVTVWAGVAATWPPLVAIQRARPRPLERLRCLTHAGGALPVAFCRDIAALFPRAQRLSFYGQTEVLRSMGTAPDDHLVPGLLGSAFPGVRVALTQPDGRPTPHGDIGELVHGGAFLPISVDGHAPAPIAALDGALGWRTGDFARRDTSGRMWFEGRRDGLIQAAGHRVSPAQVEAVIEQAPGVRSAAVVGIDDPDRGQRVVAAVQSEGALDAPALRRWCRAALPAYMVPTQWVHWPGSWPRTATGKIDRRAVARSLSPPSEPHATPDL